VDDQTPDVARTVLEAGSHRADDLLPEPSDEDGVVVVLLE
jgi:hypothetical protein